MSDPEPPIAPSRPLPRQSVDGSPEREDIGESLRSRLMSTSLLAAASVVFLAAAGAVAANQAWLTPVMISAIVAGGSVLISLSALSRCYFLSRAIRMPVAPPAARPRPAERPRESMAAAAAPHPAEEPRPERTATLPPPVSPWKGSGEREFNPLSSRDAPELRREVFGMLAYRLQSLVNRLIHRIDQVEQEIEDPELLKSLYAIDHLATRIRRQIENLAVLGGEAPQRRSDVPVEVNAILRASIAEIEHYVQVTAVPIQNAKVHGHVVAEIIHLLAELLENATTFTTPGAPKVMLRAHHVTAGLAIQVQDRGIGMSMADINRINRLLDGSTRVDVAQLLQDGRIGLAVVEILARRHNIGAELQPNIFGGTDASIVIPHELLSDVVGPTPADALPPTARHAATPAGGQASLSLPAASSQQAAPQSAPAQQLPAQPRPAPLRPAMPAAAQQAPAPSPVAQSRPYPYGQADSPAASYGTDSPAPSYRTDPPPPSYKADPPTPSYRAEPPTPSFGGSFGGSDGASYGGDGTTYGGTPASPASASPFASSPTPTAQPNAIPVVRNGGTGDDLFRSSGEAEPETADPAAASERSSGALPMRKRGESYANLRNVTEGGAIIDGDTGLGGARHPLADPVSTPRQQDPPTSAFGTSRPEPSSAFGSGPRSEMASAFGAPAPEPFTTSRADQAATDNPAPGVPASSAFDSQSTGDQSQRPALPQRRGSYMREELREPSSTARPIPGHNPNLMASLLEGRAHGRSDDGEPSEAAESDALPPDNALRNSQGDPTRWQT